MAEFECFSTSLFTFLAELTVNNNRDWFNNHKARYEREVREPALDFIRAMGPRIGDISPHFTADARKTGGSLMRVYRDTRFAKDKTPYKTNVGIQFRHRVGKDVHAPGFYVHLSLDDIFLGVGMWRPEGTALAAIRTKIDEEQDRWQQILDAPAFRAHLRQSGDSLKRPPRGYAKDHPLISALKRKDHIVVGDLTPEEVAHPGLLDLVATRFAAGADFTRFLCEAVEIPF